MLKIKPAKGLISWLLRKSGFSGVTLPWAIYILPEKLSDTILIKHERQHEQQIKQHGVVMFYIKYLWYNFKYGYFNNPFEVEARKVSRQ